MEVNTLTKAVFSILAMHVKVHKSFTIFETKAEIGNIKPQDYSQTPLYKTEQKERDISDVRERAKKEIDEKIKNIESFSKSILEIEL